MGSLLDQITQLAREWVRDNPGTPLDKLREELHQAIDRGLAPTEIENARRPEVRAGERVIDDPVLGGGLLSEEQAEMLLRRNDFKKGLKTLFLFLFLVAFTFTDQFGSEWWVDAEAKIPKGIAVQNIREVEIGTLEDYWKYTPADQREEEDDD